MDDLTRKRALWAAAKVALVTAPLGCGGVSVDDTGSGDDDSGGGGLDLPPLTLVDAGGSEEEDSGMLPSQGDLLAECRSAKGPDGVAADPVQCCDDAIASRLEAEGWQSVMEDSTLVGCCEAILGHELAWDFTSRWTCCDVVGQPSASVCMAWGPPMPPSMPEGWRPLLEVA